MHPSILLAAVERHCTDRSCTVCSGTAPFERFLELHHHNSQLAEALADLHPSTWANMPSPEHARTYLGIVLQYIQAFGYRDRLVDRFIQQIGSHYNQVRLLHSVLCATAPHPMFPPSPENFGSFVVERSHDNPILILAAIKGLLDEVTKGEMSQPETWHKMAGELEALIAAVNRSLHTRSEPTTDTPEVRSMIRDGIRALSLELVEESKTMVTTLLGKEPSSRPWPLLAVLLRGKHWKYHREPSREWTAEVAHGIAQAPPSVVKSFFTGAGSRMSCSILPKFLRDAIVHADDRNTIGWLQVCVEILGPEKAFKEFCSENHLRTAESRELVGALSAALALAPEDSPQRTNITDALNRIRELRNEIRRQRAARDAERAQAHREAQRARAAAERERRARAALAREAREARRQAIMQARRRSPPYGQLLDEWLRLAPADRLIAIAAHEAHAPASAPTEWALVPDEVLEQIETEAIENLFRRTNCVHKGHWRELNRRLRPVLAARGVHVS